ncbi:MAG: hypothetical protein ACYCPP_03645 [Nitrososphaerales archaeon]
MRKPNLARMPSYKLTPLGIPFLLSILVDVEAFGNYLKRIKVSKNDKLSLGYSFLIASIIERLIDAVLFDPLLFGVKQNKLVQRSHQKDVPYSEFPDKSNIGKMILNLSNLYRGLLPVRTFSGLRSSVKPIREFLVPELVQWGKNFEFHNRHGEKIPFVQAQRDLSAIFLLYNMHDVKYVKVALNHTFHRGKRYEPQFHELPVTISSQRFFDGFKLGLMYLWQTLLGEEAKSGFMTEVLGAKDWNEYYLAFPVVKAQVVEQAERRVDELAYAVSHRQAFHWLKRTPSKDGRRRTDFMDKLDEAFAKYEVRIVSEKYTAKVASGLIMALLGAMEFYPDSTRVIKLIHSESKGRNRYSYAVFINVPIALGDESEWWLFFDFCDDYSPRGLSAFRPIESFIQAHLARLKISTIRIKAGQLLVYVQTYPDFSKSIMDPMMREFNNLGTLSGLRLLLVGDRMEKSFAKGIILELLTYSLLTRLGYNARWRFKQAILGKEIDVLAFRETDSGENELLVIECSTVYSPELLWEIESKMQLVQSKMDDLIKIFEPKSRGRAKVSGWLVTTSKIDLTDERTSSNIRIQDWGRLTKLCKEMGIDIPRGLDDLLRKEEFPPQFVLNPSSIISGSIPPPSGKVGEERQSQNIVPILADGFLPPRTWSKILSRNKMNNDSH